jgi:hypothetical protein
MQNLFQMAFWRIGGSHHFAKKKKVKSKMLNVRMLCGRLEKKRVGL